MSPWRELMGALLSGTPVSRPAALRRSREADWLCCTDLPACASPEDCDRFRAAAEKLGWETAQENGWIQLRPAEPALSENRPAEFPSGGEGDCLRSLTRRHPGLRLTGEEEILLLKAEELAEKEKESASRTVHERLARELRERGRRRSAEEANP